MATARHLGRRSSIAVLAVTATAVAMLGLLVSQTSRQAADAVLVSTASRQRMLSERVTMSAAALRMAPPAERGWWEHRVRASVLAWQGERTRLHDMVTSGHTVSPRSTAGRALALASALEPEVLAEAARAAQPGSELHAVQAMVSAQRRYIGAIDEMLVGIEQDSSQRVDELVQLEAACVILLLVALTLALRLALYPAQEQLVEIVTALAENEARMRTMLNAMGEGMVLTDRDGRLLESNRSAQRILGFDPTAAVDLGTLTGRLVDADGKPMSLERMPSRIAIHSGEPVSDVIIGIRDDQRTIRWLSVSTHPLFRGDEATPHGAVAILHDVTEARQVEAERLVQAEARELQNQELLDNSMALEREQELFRSLVNTVGNAIVGLDLQGIIFEWNREAELLFGVPREEAIGCDYAARFIPSRHRDRMRAGIESVLQGESLRNYTGPVRGATGGRRTVIWNITPLFGPGEEVHGLIAAGLDITEREASEQRFRLLFERSSDAHLLLDEGRVIDCNDATLGLLLCEGKGQLVDRSMDEISPKRQPDGRLSLVVGAQMRQIARDRGYHRFEWVHRRMDGRDFPVEVTLTPVRLDGRDVILSVWHDIAERKAVETALRSAKDAAESANRTKSEFMTRMNHELRTPLTAIIGFSRVLLQGKQGALSEGAQRYADRIRANGMHLLSLINQILDVAKVEAGRMELEPERIAVDELVRETVQMLESTAEVKGIALRTELPGVMGSVVTDATKLRQILINLVGNAIKFTDVGEVCVKVEIDADSLRPVSVTIRDTGIGIPLDRQQKVFDPFEQGDSSTRRQFGGTGLGLSIVKAFAELIGAAIEVESEVGMGTAFTIWLAPIDLEFPRA